MKTTVCLGIRSKFAILFALAWLPLAVAQAEPGWAVHYYGEPTFWLHAGVVQVESATVTLDMDRVKWPAQNWDRTKGPVFYRGGGWSLAAYATLRVPAAGEYRFATENGVALLRVNGCQVDPTLQPGITLPAGNAALALFIKPAARPTKPADARVTVTLLWQPPGTDKLVPVPAELLTHGEQEWTHNRVYAPDFPLTFAQGEERWSARRRFTVDLPEAGTYEIAAHLGGVPRLFTVSLDDQPVLYVQGDRVGIADPLYDLSAAAGSNDRQRLDFLHRARTARPLAKGKHTVDVYGHYGPWIWGDEMKDAMEQFSVGLTRLDSTDPLNSLAVYAKGRSDMVFRRGEPLSIGIEQATAAAQNYRVEIVEQRGDGEIVWQGEARLPAGKSWAKSEVVYPCDREGAFEYTVRDAAGRAVDGPWAFVVVDTTPVARPRQTADGKVSEVRKELVDSVDCTLAEETAHKFRDNGTSQVVDGPAGRYRATGTAKLRPVGYVKDKESGSWRRTNPDEKQEAGYYAADWFAYTLKVKNPGKPHLVVSQVPNDVRRLVSIYATDQVTGHYNGWVLDAGEAPEAGPFSPVSFVVWPNGNAIDVCVWCSNNNHNSTLNRQGAAAKLELYELPDGLPALPEAAGGWAAGPEFGWNGEQVNLGVNERTMPPLWPGNDLIPGQLARFAWDGAAYHDWKALQTSWERFGQFSAYRGDNLCITPVHTYGMNFLQGDAERMLPKLWDIYSKGYRGRVVDPMERDIFKLMLLTAQKYGVRLVADFMVHRLEGIAPLLAKQAGVPEDGILVTDDTGKPWVAVSGIRMMNPANPVARKYMIDLMDALGRQYGSSPAFAGVRTRQWTGWPSGLDGWFVNEKLGYDDATVDLFTRETGVKLPVTATDETRFKARREFLLGTQREAWLDWRCRKVLTLREEMLAALRRYSPDARLFSDAKFSREGGLDPKLLANRRDLGWGAAVGSFGGDGVEWNDPDPVDFANFDVREPASLHRNLQNLVPNGRTYPEGMCGNQSYRSHPYQLEGPALALAEGKLETCVYGGQWCLPPADEGLRRFVQAWRAIPALKYTRQMGEGGEQGPVACWSATDGKDLVLYLVNRTPRPRQVEIVFDTDLRTATELVTGQALPAGRKLRTELAAFMPAVFRVKGVRSVSELLVPAHLAEVTKLGRWMDHLRTLRPAAQGFTQTRVGTGPALVANPEEDGAFGLADQTFTFDQLFNPLEAAWQADRPHEVARLFDVFQRDHAWWYEAFGWPADVYVPLTDAGGQHTSGSDLVNRIKLASPETKAEFGEVSGFKDKFLLIPSGRTTVRCNPKPGRYYLRVWGLFGGEYGPVQVEFMGKPVGRLGVAGGPVRQIHQLLPTPLSWPWSPQDITLISEGKRGLAITAVEVSPVPPAPIRKWSAIGLFDKKAAIDDWPGMETVFPPEQGIDLKATYPGLGGKPATWRQIDLGKLKYIPLLEHFPYDASQGNGVAYLATWVYSPHSGNPRAAVLYYAIDWYGKAWLNGQPIMPKIGGPWKQFGAQDVQLQPGWNCLLVKTATGRSGWKATFAVSDPGDLKYSDTPPEAPAKAP